MGTLVEICFVSRKKIVEYGEGQLAVKGCLLLTTQKVVAFIWNSQDLEVRWPSYVIYKKIQSEKSKWY